MTVKTCLGRRCVLKKGASFRHFGEVDRGVDTRGEVGLLTRNVRIHGEMEEACYGTLQNCSAFGQDTFGGHVIARKGFAAFRVEHAEFTNLGQLGLYGR